MMGTVLPLIRHVSAAKGPSRFSDLQERGRSRLVDGFSDFAESWRYTSLIASDATPWVPVAQAPQTIDKAPTQLIADAARLMLVNGRLRRDLSSGFQLPEGVTVCALADAEASALGKLGSLATADDGLIQSLNAAQLADGLLISVAPGVQVTKPIELDWLALASDRPLMLAPRLFVHLGRGAELTLIENRRGIGQSLETRVAEIEISDNARLTHITWQDADQVATSLAAAAVLMGRDARLHSVTLTTGGAVSRTETRVMMNGPGAEATVNNVWLLRSRQHGETVVKIDHNAPHCASHQLAKGVLDDASRGVFQGRIAVARGAQKTDGYQMSRSLLLSDQAEADAKPELEIFADDVKCSHGSTVGRLDEASLFYLQSRGVTRADAEAMLVAAFVEEVIDTIPESLRPSFADRAHEWLHNRMKGHRG